MRRHRLDPAIAHSDGAPILGVSSEQTDHENVRLTYSRLKRQISTTSPTTLRGQHPPSTRQRHAFYSCALMRGKVGSGRTNCDRIVQLVETILLHFFILSGTIP